MPASIPLFLLTGFLGSGKSTLLSRLIRHPGFADTAVIVNEFGEVGLDHALVSQGEEGNTVLLDSGCICCTLTTSLEETLEALYYKAERGEIPRFARVVVETTGLADPGPIATSLAGGTFVSRFVHLAAILTTLDGHQGADHLAQFAEARLQLAMADRAIVTKSDVATDIALAKTLGAATRLNPRCDRLMAVSGDIDPACVLMYGLTGNRQRSASPPSCGHDASEADAHLQAHGYVTCAVPIETPVTWSGYAAWVAHLQSVHADSLLRVKGLVTFEDGRVHAVQGVRLLFDPPRPVDWPVEREVRDTMVLIARNTDTATLAASVSLLGKASA
ncbi:CobW family GTP-binding protein [Stappia stellulata]|uniref:CobW family GTP-binding protein n=1 Tax=Stappia stellulata TaxID=71235 RepID=UPI000421F1BC|nr:GTP-binding protein [Stappia stellulata]